ESRRSDRLFNDPYAAAFLTAAPNAFEREQQAAATGVEGMAKWGAAFWAHAVIRTKFFDDYLIDAVNQGLRQIVLLAAGLDTRAYRLDWPDGTHLFELDLSEVLDFKLRMLTGHAAVARCEHQAVRVDLRSDWTTPLTSAGLDTAEPTAWLAEGLLTYLSADDAARLLTTVGDLSAPGSRVAFEYDVLGTDAMRAQARTMPPMEEYVALWKGGLPTASDWLKQRGWHPALHDRAEVAARYGRHTDEASTGGFITAIRG
ncbi:MAG: SAM-dependent methyltransferase, partial [Nocardioidaceae bacterium]